MTKPCHSCPGMLRVVRTFRDAEEGWTGSLKLSLKKHKVHVNYIWLGESLGCGCLEPGRAAGAERSSGVLPALPCGRMCRGRCSGAGCRPWPGCGGSGWHRGGCLFVQGLPAQPPGSCSCGLGAGVRGLLQLVRVKARAGGMMVESRLPST